MTTQLAPTLHASLMWLVYTPGGWHEAGQWGPPRHQSRPRAQPTTGTLREQPSSPT